MWSMMTKLKHVQQTAADLSIPTEYAFFTLRHGTGVALQTKSTEVSKFLNRTEFKWDAKKYGYVRGLVHSHWIGFFTLQEEQSLCFLKAWQSIHLGQPRITCPSPFRVAGVGRSIITRF